jgi:hypothetical protein
MKTIVHVQVASMFLFLVAVDSAIGSTNDVVFLLKELRNQALILKTVPTQQQQTKLNTLSLKLAILAKSSADNRQLIRDELAVVMKPRDSLSSFNNEAFFASFLMRALVKTCSTNQLLKFSEELVLTDEYRADMKVELLRMLGYEFRAMFTAEDLKPLLSKAARLNDASVSATAIKMLTGWTQGELTYAPISKDEGVQALNEQVAKHPSFDSQLPFLERLAELGEGRHLYVDRLRQNFEDNQVPVSLRHKYATKLAEWYEFLGQELEAEMSRDISHDNAISIKAD